MPAMFWDAIKLADMDSLEIVIHIKMGCYHLVNYADVL